MAQQTVADFASYLTGPWIFHKTSGWSEGDVPSWARDNLNEARLLASKNEPGLCSHVEAAIYLSSAWSAAPQSSEWVDIFQYATGLAMGVDKMPADLHVDKLTRYQGEMYSDLRAKIYSAVIKHSNAKGKKHAR